VDHLSAPSQSAKDATSRAIAGELRRPTRWTESAAKRRLADEYGAAQERGEVGKRGDFGGVTSRGEHTPTVADIGLPHKEVHEARQIRDAEEANPGVVRRTRGRFR
jgi:hypothetical protein